MPTNSGKCIKNETVQALAWWKHINHLHQGSETLGKEGLFFLCNKITCTVQRAEKELVSLLS